MWLRVVVAVTVIIMMMVLSGSNEIHLIDATTLWAALDGTVTGDSQPDCIVGVSREAGTAKVSIGGMDIRYRALMVIHGLKSFVGEC